MNVLFLFNYDFQKGSLYSSFVIILKRTFYKFYVKFWGNKFSYILEKAFKHLK